MKMKNKFRYVFYVLSVILSLSIKISTPANDNPENYISDMFMIKEEKTELMSIEFLYYQSVFGYRFNAVPRHISSIVDREKYRLWRNEFSDMTIGGHRDPRDFHLLSVIQTFNISKEDFIAAHERAMGNIPIYEIDRLVTWARNNDHTAMTLEERDRASFWIHQYSLQEIEALYSNDIEQLWAAFPGAGAMINGRVYSPEWIINNMEQAIVEERIPVTDILDVMQFTSHFYELEDTNRMARSAFRRGVLRLRLIEMEENNIEYIPYEDILLDISYN